MTWNIQASMTNLGRKPLIETEPVSSPQSRATDQDAGFSDLGSRPASRSVQLIILTPEGDEIAPPVEILEEDEAEPIHHSLCPCLLCSEKHRNWPGEQHHPQCQCGLCEEQEPAADLGAPSLAPPKAGEHDPHQLYCQPERGAAESRDLQVAHSSQPAPNETQGTGPEAYPLLPTPYPLPRIARAAALLSAFTQRDLSTALGQSPNISSETQSAATKPNTPPVLQQPWPRVSSRRRMSPSLPDSSIPTPQRASKTSRCSSTATNTGQPTSAHRSPNDPTSSKPSPKEKNLSCEP